jgi:hypothetical protein
MLATTLVFVLTITAAIAVGSGLIKFPWPDRSPIATPMPTTALLPCVESSATPTDSGSPAAMTWSPERAAEDWPGAVRAEPTGCVPVVVDARMGETSRGLATRLFSDPRGDAMPTALTWADIVELEFSPSHGFPIQVAFHMAADAPEPIPSPSDEWIAYGIVVDTTGDGQPDLRYGIDNAPDGDGQSIGRDLRIWETDLATGTTDASRCCQSLSASIDFWWPGELGPTRGSVHVPGPRPWRNGEVYRFYLWASVIRDGEIVSTDYAPDFGWLLWP